MDPFNQGSSRHIHSQKAPKSTSHVPSKVQVDIEYGALYAKLYAALLSALSDLQPNISINARQANNPVFEVFIQGRQVHSMANGGGWPDNNAIRQIIVKELRDVQNPANRKRVQDATIDRFPYSESYGDGGPRLSTLNTHQRSDMGSGNRVSGRPPSSAEIHRPASPLSSEGTNLYYSFSNGLDHDGSFASFESLDEDHDEYSRQGPFGALGGGGDNDDGNKQVHRGNTALGQLYNAQTNSSSSGRTIPMSTQQNFPRTQSAGGPYQHPHSNQLQPVNNSYISQPNRDSTSRQANQSRNISGYHPNQEQPSERMDIMDAGGGDYDDDDEDIPEELLQQAAENNAKTQQYRDYYQSNNQNTEDIARQLTDVTAARIGNIGTRAIRDVEISEVTITRPTLLTVNYQAQRQMQAQAQKEKSQLHSKTKSSLKKSTTKSSGDKGKSAGTTPISSVNTNATNYNATTTDIGSRSPQASITSPSPFPSQEGGAAGTQAQEQSMIDGNSTTPQHDITLTSPHPLNISTTDQNADDGSEPQELVDDGTKKQLIMHTFKKRRRRIYYTKGNDTNDKNIADFQPIPLLRLPVEYPFTSCFTSLFFVVILWILAGLLYHFVPNFIAIRWADFPMQIEGSTHEFARSWGLDKPKKTNLSFDSRPDMESLFVPHHDHGAAVNSLSTFSPSTVKPITFESHAAYHEHSYISKDTNDIQHKNTVYRHHFPPSSASSSSSLSSPSHSSSNATHHPTRHQIPTQDDMVRGPLQSNSKTTFAFKSFPRSSFHLDENSQRTYDRHYNRTQHNKSFQQRITTTLARIQERLMASGASATQIPPSQESTHTLFHPMAHTAAASSTGISPESTIDVPQSTPTSTHNRNRTPFSSAIRPTVRIQQDIPTTNTHIPRNMRSSSPAGGYFRNLGLAAAKSQPNTLILDQLDAVSLIRSTPQRDVQVFYTTPKDDIFNIQHMRKIKQFEDDTTQSPGFHRHCLLDWQHVKSGGQVLDADGAVVVDPETEEPIQGALLNQKMNAIATAEILLGNHDFGFILDQTVVNILNYNEDFREGLLPEVKCQDPLGVLRPSYDGYEPKDDDDDGGGGGNGGDGGGPNPFITLSPSQSSSRMPPTADGTASTPFAVSSVKYYAPPEVTCVGVFCNPLGLLSPTGELIEDLKNRRLGLFSMLPVPVLDSSAVTTSPDIELLSTFAPIWYDYIDTSYGPGSLTASALKTTFQLGIPLDDYDSGNAQLNQQNEEIQLYVVDDLMTRLIDRAKSTSPELIITFEPLQSGVFEGIFEKELANSIPLFALSVFACLLALIIMFRSFWMGVFGVFLLLSAGVPAFFIYRLLGYNYFGLYHALAVLLTLYVGSDLLSTFHIRWDQCERWYGSIPILSRSGRLRFDSTGKKKKDGAKTERDDADDDDYSDDNDDDYVQSNVLQGLRRVRPEMFVDLFGEISKPIDSSRAYMISWTWRRLSYTIRNMVPTILVATCCLAFSCVVNVSMTLPAFRAFAVFTTLYCIFQVLFILFLWPSVITCHRKYLNDRKCCLIFSGQVRDINLSRLHNGIVPTSAFNATSQFTTTGGGEFATNPDHPTYQRIPAGDESQPDVSQPLASPPIYPDLETDFGDSHCSSPSLDAYSKQYHSNNHHQQSPRYYHHHLSSGSSSPSYPYRHTTRLPRHAHSCRWNERPDDYGLFDNERFQNNHQPKRSQRQEQQSSLKSPPSQGPLPPPPSLPPSPRAGGDPINTTVTPPATAAGSGGATGNPLQQPSMMVVDPQQISDGRLTKLELYFQRSIMRFVMKNRFASIFLILVICGVAIYFATNLEIDNRDVGGSMFVESHPINNYNTVRSLFRNGDSINVEIVFGLDAANPVDRSSADSMNPKSYGAPVYSQRLLNSHGSFDLYRARYCILTMCDYITQPNDVLRLSMSSLISQPNCLLSEMSNWLEYGNVEKFGISRIPLGLYNPSLTEEAFWHAYQLFLTFEQDYCRINGAIVHCLYKYRDNVILEQGDSSTPDRTALITKVHTIEVQLSQARMIDYKDGISLFKTWERGVGFMLGSQSPSLSCRSEQTLLPSATADEAELALYAPLRFSTDSDGMYISGTASNHQQPPQHSTGRVTNPIRRSTMTVADDDASNASNVDGSHMVDLDARQPTVGSEETTQNDIIPHRIDSHLSPLFRLSSKVPHSSSPMSTMAAETSSPSVPQSDTEFRLQQAQDTSIGNTSAFQIGTGNIWDPWHFFFYQRVLGNELIRAVCLSGAVVFLVMLLYTGNIIVTFLFLLCIAADMAVLLGAIWFFKMKVSITTAIPLITAPGISAYTLTRFAEAYSLSQAYNPSDKVREALTRNALSIVFAICTSLIASCFFLISQTALFRDFGAMILVIFLFHTLLVLFAFPSLLVLAGPTGTYGNLYYLILRTHCCIARLKRFNIKGKHIRAEKRVMKQGREIDILLRKARFNAEREQYALRKQYDAHNSRAQHNLDRLEQYERQQMETLYQQAKRFEAEYLANNPQLYDDGGISPRHGDDTQPSDASHEDGVSRIRGPLPNLIPQFLAAYGSESLAHDLAVQSTSPRHGYRPSTQGDSDRTSTTIDSRAGLPMSQDPHVLEQSITKHSHVHKQYTPSLVPIMDLYDHDHSGNDLPRPGYPMPAPTPRAGSMALPMPGLNGGANTPALIPEIELSRVSTQRPYHHRPLTPLHGSDSFSLVQSSLTAAPAGLDVQSSTQPQLERPPSAVTVSTDDKPPLQLVIPDSGEGAPLPENAAPQEIADHFSNCLVYTNKGLLTVKDYFDLNVKILQGNIQKLKELPECKLIQYEWDDMVDNAIIHAEVHCYKQGNNALIYSQYQYILHRQQSQLENSCCLRCCTCSCRCCCCCASPSSQRRNAQQLQLHSTGGGEVVYNSYNPRSTSCCYTYSLSCFDFVVYWLHRFFCFDHCYRTAKRYELIEPYVHHRPYEMIDYAKDIDPITGQPRDRRADDDGNSTRISPEQQKQETEEIQRIKDYKHHFLYGDGDMPFLQNNAEVLKHEYDPETGHWRVQRAITDDDDNDDDPLTSQDKNGKKTSSKHQSSGDKMRFDTRLVDDPAERARRNQLNQAKLEKKIRQKQRYRLDVRGDDPDDVVIPRFIPEEGIPRDDDDDDDDDGDYRDSITVSIQANHKSLGLAYQSKGPGRGPVSGDKLRQQQHKNRQQTIDEMMLEQIDLSDSDCDWFSISDDENDDAGAGSLIPPHNAAILGFDRIPVSNDPQNGQVYEEYMHQQQRPSQQHLQSNQQRYLNDPPDNYYHDHIGYDSRHHDDSHTDDDDDDDDDSDIARVRENTAMMMLTRKSQVPNPINNQRSPAMNVEMTTLNPKRDHMHKAQNGKQPPQTIPDPHPSHLSPSPRHMDSAISSHIDTSNDQDTQQS